MDKQILLILGMFFALNAQAEYMQVGRWTVFSAGSGRRCDRDAQEVGAHM